MHWCAFLLALAASALSLPVVPRQTTTPTRALWLWESDLIQDDSKVSQFLSVVGSPDNGITTVLALIDRGMGNDPWESFLKKCTAAGLTVEALMGDAQWIVDKTTDDGPTLQAELNWIEQYQGSASADAKFAGIHMDVEPWSLDDWTANEGAYVDKLVSIADTTKTFAKTLSLTVSADLPFWANTVACGDAQLDTCMLAHLDSVTFMTYRNTPVELLDVAAPAMKAVNSADPEKPVWFAVETKSSVADASLISYAGKSVATLLDDLATVEKSATSKYTGFAGIAIHSYKDFLAMGG